MLPPWPLLPANSSHFPYQCLSIQPLAVVDFHHSFPWNYSSSSPPLGVFIQKKQKCWAYPILYSCKNTVVYLQWLTDIKRDGDCKTPFSLAHVVNFVEVKAFHNELSCSCDVSTKSVYSYIAQPNSSRMTNFLVQKHACHMPQISLAISDSLYKHFVSFQAMSHVTFITCYKTNYAHFRYPLNLQTFKEKQMQGLFVCWGQRLLKIFLVWLFCIELFSFDNIIQDLVWTQHDRSRRNGQILHGWLRDITCTDCFLRCYVCGGDGREKGRRK